ncbi:RNA-binding protein 12 [Bienertia sinuspersici]
MENPNNNEAEYGGQLISVDASETGLEREVENQVQPTDQTDNVAYERESEIIIGSSSEAPKTKKHRGPTKKTDIHARTKEERTPIILNCYGQPIGPTEKDVKEFSQFLGTVARNTELAPLNYVDWPIKQKYLDALEHGGSKWNELCELVPEDELNDLIAYWNTSPAKEQSKKNKRNRQVLDDMHTMGPKSYVILHHKLKQEDPNKQEPSKAKLYKNSRIRNPNKTYKTSYGKTKANMCRRGGPLPPAPQPLPPPASPLPLPPAAPTPCPLQPPAPYCPPLPATCCPHPLLPPPSPPATAVPTPCSPNPYYHILRTHFPFT